MTLSHLLLSFVWSKYFAALDFSLGLLGTLPGHQFSTFFPEVLTIYTRTSAILLWSFHTPAINYISNIPSSQSNALCQSTGFLLLFSTLKNILTQGQSSLSSSGLPFKSSFADYIFISKSVVKECPRKSVGPGDRLSCWHHLCSIRGIGLQLSLGSQLTRSHCLPDGHCSQMVVALAQHWPHCTALRSVLTCCLWHLYFRSSVSSHSTYINTMLWSFLPSPVPQLKQKPDKAYLHSSLF